MRNSTHFIFLFTILSIHLYGQANYVLDWAKNIGELSDNYGYEIVIDNNENTYICGTFTTTQDFGGIVLTAQPPADFFIAKYDPTGNLLWVNQGGGTSTWYEEGRSMVVDENEDVYVMGSYYGEGDFSGVNLTSFGGYDAFIAKYDVDGNLMWINEIKGASVDLGKELALDADGNLLCLSGTQSLYITFDSNTVLTSDNENGSLFVSKYSSDGNLMWAKQVASNVFHNLFGFEVDANNNIVIAATVIFNASFQGIPFTSNGFSDGFLGKYNPIGDLQWFQQIGSEEDVICNSLCLDFDDNIYITGDFKKTANFAGIEITSNGEQDIFVAKYDSNGSAIWATGAGDENRDEAFDIDYSPNDEIFIVGRFQDSLIFENQTLISNGLWDVFRTRYDVDGNHMESGNFGGDGQTYFDDRAWGIDISPNGSVAITGNFSGEMDLGTDTLISNGQHDIYIIKWKIDEKVGTQPHLEAVDDIQLFPNPTDNFLTIAPKKSYQKAFVNIFSLDGQSISTIEFTNNESIQIKLPSTAGTYNITLKIDNFDTITKQVVKI